LPVCLPQL